MIMPFRQIHLDFHTSEAIAGIGSRFNPEKFAAQLAEAGVNSVTCFARCHHGWMYYDSKLFPERMHPHLVRPLLEEQIAACHARGIRVPVYTTIQWDHYTAEQHPEWLVMDEQGTVVGTKPYAPGFTRRLCLNTPYVDFIFEHVRELLTSMPVDGFFFDIVLPQNCSCATCRRHMRAIGIDPSDETARRRFGREVTERFQERLTALVTSIKPDCTIFYNSGHISPWHRNASSAFTHFELESLPGGGWGYLHFPITARYARTLGKPCLGMTGKFHTSWGDFHSFKNQAALEYECFRMLALGAACSIGDQLHPSGELSRPVYDLIGRVYRTVAAKEPWCAGAKPVAEIGVLHPQAFPAPAPGAGSGSPAARNAVKDITQGHGDGPRVHATLGGVNRMLEESRHQFDIIDAEADWERYALLILPDTIALTPELAGRLRDYLAKGGAVIASYQAGLTPDGTDFALREFGVRYLGEAPYSPDFIVPRPEFAAGLPITEHVMYRRGTKVAPGPGAKVLADVAVPYFNRDYRHFCSHRHTPSTGAVCYPGVVQHGRVIYFAHPIFSQYADIAPQWCRTLLLSAIERLLPSPTIRVAGPSTLMATVNDLDDGRRVVHLLHYIPERRGKDFDIIEDVIPLYDVAVTLKVKGPVQSLRLVPEGTALTFSQEGDLVSFVVPKVAGHTMVEAVCGS